MSELQEIVLGNRVSKKLHARLIAEQKRIAKDSGVRVSLNEVVRILLEKGLEANGKKR